VIAVAQQAVQEIMNIELIVAYAQVATPFNGIASGTHTIYVRDTTTGC
jgi:hypothetical protein